MLKHISFAGIDSKTDLKELNVGLTWSRELEIKTIGFH